MSSAVPVLLTIGFVAGVIGDSLYESGIGNSDRINQMNAMNLILTDAQKATFTERYKDLLTLQEDLKSKGQDHPSRKALEVEFQKKAFELARDMGFSNLVSPTQQAGSPQTTASAINAPALVPAPAK